VLFVLIFAVYFIFKKRYAVLVLFCGGVVAALIPWAYRNFIIYHQFILTTMIGQYNLWIGNRLESTGGQIAGGVNQLIEYAAVYGFYSVPQKAKQEFLLFLTGHPLVFIKLCVLRTIRYFSLIRPMGFWFYQHGIKQAVFVFCSGVWIALTFIGGFGGLVMGAYKRRDGLVVAGILALSAPLLLLPTVVESRYRFQIYPFLAIFGSYVVLERKKIFKEQRGLALGILVFLFGITVADAATFWPVILDHLKTLGL
jgi:hypothetical protein